MSRIGETRRPRACRIVAAIALTGLAAGLATAQDEETRLQVIEVKEIDNKPAIWGMITMGLLIAMAVGANAIPSRRGHQD